MPVESADVKDEKIAKELLEAKFGNKPTSQADRDEARRIARMYREGGKVFRIVLFVLALTGAIGACESRALVIADTECGKFYYEASNKDVSAPFASCTKGDVSVQVGAESSESINARIAEMTVMSILPLIPKPVP